MGVSGVSWRKLGTGTGLRRWLWCASLLTACTPTHMQSMVIGGCPEYQVTVTELGNHRYRAEGCGQFVIYRCEDESCWPETAVMDEDQPGTAVAQPTRTHVRRESQTASVDRATRQQAPDGKANVSIELRLGGNALLQLWTSPERHGELAQIRLKRLEAEPEIQKCQLQLNGQQLALPASKATRNERISALITEVNREIVRELGTARQLAVRACALRWTLSGEQLHEVQRFVALYEEELAWRGGERGTTAGLLAPSGGWPAWQVQGSAPPALGGPNLDATAVFRRVAPAVVLVEAKQGSGVSQGSGVVVSASEIATNCHVLEGARKIIVKQEQKSWIATLARSDPARDRCILSIPEPVLKPIEGVRPYAELQVGEALYTLGSPSGLELSLSSGILSGLREDDGHKLVQTTAPISPGSSGGGLFDAKGNLVGITTLVLAGRERLNQALNFAIPAESFWQP